MAMTEFTEHLNIVFGREHISGRHSSFLVVLWVICVQMHRVKLLLRLVQLLVNILDLPFR